MVGTGHTYRLFISCTDEKGNSYPTGPLNEQAITVADTLPPSQITSLSIGNTSFTQLLLNWSPSDDGVGGTTAGNMRYKVYHDTVSPVAIIPANLLSTVLSGGTSYLHTGLTPNSTHFYQVVAVDQSDNESAPSNEATATTTADTTVPTFAGNTSATIVTTTGTNSIGLSWTAASDNVTATSALSYRVYRCVGATTCDPYAGTLVTTVPNGATVFTDTSLSASTVYVYGFAR